MILAGLLAIALLIGVAVGIANYALIRAAAHPADHRHAVDELHLPVDGHLVQPRPPHQAAGALAEFTTASTLRHPERRADRACAVGRRLGAAAPHSLYGRWITAIGQSLPAARLAGIPVDGMRFVTYVLCAVLAALCGYLLSGFSGGAALNMGAEYLLDLDRRRGDRRHVGGRRQQPTCRASGAPRCSCSWSCRCSTPTALARARALSSPASSSSPSSWWPAAAKGGAR